MAPGGIRDKVDLERGGCLTVQQSVRKPLSKRCALARRLTVYLGRKNAEHENKTKNHR